MPMPPAPLPRATTAEIFPDDRTMGRRRNATQIQCAGGTDGEAVDAGPLMPDPFAVSPVCARASRCGPAGIKGQQLDEPRRSLYRVPFPRKGSQLSRSRERSIRPPTSPIICNSVNGNSERAGRDYGR